MAMDIAQSSVSSLLSSLASEAWAPDKGPWSDLVHTRDEQGSSEARHAPHEHIGDNGGKLCEEDGTTRLKQHQKLYVTNERVIGSEKNKQTKKQCYLNQASLL